MSTSSSSHINEVPNSNKKNSIWKKAIRVGPLVLVPLHESIVKELHIDETSSWFEEVSTSEGILLRVSRCSESSGLPQEMST
jgi:hypothetical protein